MATAQDLYTSGAYQETNADWHEAGSPWKAAQILKILNRNALRPASIADIGCGVGRICAELARQVPSAQRLTGYDIAPEAIRLARERYGDERLSYELADMLETDEQADLVLCIDVFEHVEDYMGFLRKLSRHGEYFVFHVPLEMNASAILRERYLYTRERVGHIHYFSTASTLATLRDTGYEIVDHLYTAGTMELPSAHRGLITTAANSVRRLLPQDLCAKLLGGMSLLVLCRPAR